jgi:OOP family OmpA-OmpF porin
MNTFFRASLMAALALAASGAWAQSGVEGWYGGFSFGQSKIKIDDSTVVVAGATASSVSKDETDTGFKLYAGRRFNPNFALEGGYTDFGKFSATRTVTAPSAGSFGVSIKSSGFHVDAVGILPINRFDLFAKAGVIYTTTKADFSSSGAVSAPGNNKKSEFDGKYGFGASYRLSQALALRAEWERALKVGDPDKTGEGDIDLLSVGLNWRF